jgi:hypothetical protein
MRHFVALCEALAGQYARRKRCRKAAGCVEAGQLIAQV